MGQDARHYSGYNTTIATLTEHQSIKPHQTLHLWWQPWRIPNLLQPMLVRRFQWLPIAIACYTRHVWAYHKRWKNFHPQLSGVHWVISLSGCIRKPWPWRSHCWYAQKVDGKKCPTSINPLRFVVLELLPGFVRKMVEYEHLIMFLTMT